MTREAEAAFERAFLGVLRRRFPGVVWRLVGPREGAQREAPAAPGEVVGRLAAQQDERPVADRALPPATSAGATRTTPSASCPRVARAPAIPVPERLLDEQWSAWRVDGLLQSGTDLPRPGCG